MQDPGTLIAVDVLLLYAILGPVVLFAIYVLFDSVDKLIKRQTDKTSHGKSPALWTKDDVAEHLNRM